VEHKRELGSTLTRASVRASAELQASLALLSACRRLIQKKVTKEDQYPGTAPTLAIPALVPGTDFGESLRD